VEGDECGAVTSRVKWSFGKKGMVSEKKPFSRIQLKKRGQRTRLGTPKEKENTRK